MTKLDSESYIENVLFYLPEMAKSIFIILSNFICDLIICVLHALGQQGHLSGYHYIL